MSNRGSDGYSSSSCNHGVTCRATEGGGTLLMMQLNASHAERFSTFDGQQKLKASCQCVQALEGPRCAAAIPNSQEKTAIEHHLMYNEAMQSKA